MLSTLLTARYPSSLKRSLDYGSTGDEAAGVWFLKFLELLMRKWILGGGRGEQKWFKDVIAVLSASSIAISSASAATVTFTKIADTSGAFRSFGGVSINNAGTVAFLALLDTDNEQTISVGSGFGVTNIIAASGPAGTLKDPIINDAGIVAFVSMAPGPTAIEQSINLANAGAITTIVTSNGASVDFGDLSLNNGGAVAFREVASSGVRSIKVAQGGTSTTVIDNSGPLGSIGTPTINDDGSIAFGAATSLAERTINIIAADGSISTIVDDGEPFVDLGRAFINNAGGVAFWADGEDGERAIIVREGGASRTIADTSGPFSTLGNPSLNDEGTVAFYTNRDAGGAAVYLSIGSLLMEVISTGDTLDGLIVAQIGLGIDVNNKNELAFRVIFANGTSAIYRASVSDVAEVPLPGAAWLFIAGLSALAMSRRSRFPSNLSSLQRLGK